MEPNEFEGKNTEEAIYKACKHFSTTPEKLEITILSTGSTGIFGLVGSKKAKIRALFKEQPPEEPLVDLSDLQKEFSYRPEPPVQPEVTEPPQEPEEEVSIVETAEEEIDTADVDVDVDVDVEADLEEGEEEEEDFELESDSEPVEVGEHDQEAVDTAKEILENVIRLASMSSQVQGEISEGRVQLNVTGESSGLLIGKKGKTLDALQYLVTKMVSKRLGKRIHVVVDSENYRGRRRKTLAEMALRLGEKAKRAGKPVTVSPMNAHDRRIIHLALQDDKQLRTKSKGEGLLKRIIIFPQRSAKTKSPKKD